MDDRHEVAALIGSRWGTHAVLLEVNGGDSLRAPLPEPMAVVATEGRTAAVFLNPEGRLDGWSIPDVRVGVRMHAEQERGGADVKTLDCQGRCQTLWHLVAGGNVSPLDNCLTCGDPVTPSPGDASTA